MKRGIVGKITEQIRRIRTAEDILSTEYAMEGLSKILRGR